MVGAPKYGKIELLILEDSNDERIVPNTKIEFEDCGLVITGDYMIIVTDEKNSSDKIATTTGRIFPLKKIFAYKTYNE